MPAGAEENLKKQPISKGVGWTNRYSTAFRRAARFCLNRLLGHSIGFSMTHPCVPGRPQ